MSLPPAKKQVSEHPAKDAVASPTNKAEKEADISRKIRLYGIIEAFRKGRLPTNVQIDNGLKYIHNNSPVDVDLLSPEGRRLVHDTRDIIDTARLIIQEKNADELFQNFIWHTRDIDRETIKQPTRLQTNGDATQTADDTEQSQHPTAKADSEQAITNLRTLLHIVLTNSEARKLLSDFSVIGRDLLSKSAVKASELIAPHPEALQRTHEPAPADEFISSGGRHVGPEETPVLEANVPGTETTFQSRPGEEPRVRMGGGEGAETERLFSDAREEVQDRVVGRGEDVRTNARQHAEDVTMAEAPAEETQKKKSKLMDKMKGITHGITDRIPPQHKGTAQEHYERGRHFLTEEYFPEERRDQFIFRGKKVIIECQKHDDYQKSIRWLLDYIKDYAQRGHRGATAHRTAAQGVTSSPKVDLALRELRTILERFANNSSLDDVIDATNVLIDDSRRDPELRRWFTDANDYARRVLLEPGFVIDDECGTMGDQLRERGRHFYDDKYRDQFDSLFNSVSAWFNAMGEDPLNKRFGEDWARLTKDLLFDSEGRIKFKQELWDDIRKVILPQIINKVGYLPIPRVEYTDDELDLIVENLTLQGRNLFPNIISLDAQNYFKFSPYDAITDVSHHRVTLTFEQMQADMRDVAFYYRKKTGIKMSDSGIADVLVGGQGLSATVVLNSATRDKSSVFKVESVDVKADTLKFSIRDAKHGFLYKTIKPIATRLLKKQIQKVFKDVLTTGLEYLDGQLVSVRDRMESAKAEEGMSRTQVLRNLSQRKKDEASVKSPSALEREKSVKKPAQPHHQFKIVSHKRDSIIGVEGHPAGWVRRTDEKEEAVEQGEEWKSDVFDMVERKREASKGPAVAASSREGPAMTAGSREGPAAATNLKEGPTKTANLKEGSTMAANTREGPALAASSRAPVPVPAGVN
ncbi:hypothetical protein P691DRAFT_763168 [Macrolepiota fuliginosa MF-IS2]|uniref:Uncharacterized protein n=1 Tax=Macrolepiota fuliginosa MF-IS2 TaxID=1400762 RepID=A0A9P5X7D0_9AGAR|nr:hypothetical protein P691DRAFT_763168 [Macrolepiota fuliginosa MF-IS2]